MLRNLITFLAIVAALTAFPQTNRTGEGLLRGEAGFTAGLNTDGWQSDFSIAYFPVDYFGLKLSLGTAAEIECFNDWGVEDWMKSQDYAIRLKVIPAIALRTPQLCHFKSPDSGLSLFAEPGLTLAPGASGSEGAKTVCWDFRCGFNLQFGNAIVSIGYEASNFTLYSGRPLSHYAAPDKDKYTTNSVFIGIGGKF